MDPSVLYLEHLQLIDRISDALCRRNGVRDADAADFAADVRLKLLQDDYAVLRKYRGDSSIATFLTVVIGNLFRDHRIKLWGKWRPSAEARRRGEVAVLLETAVYRDGRTFEEACVALEQSPRTQADRTELRRVFAELPRRVRPRPADDADLDAVEAPEQADGELLEQERRARFRAASAALHRALAELPHEDCLIVRLHYLEGMPVADIARALHLQQKPLYPRIRRLLRDLSKRLEGEGIGREYLQTLDSAAS